MKILLIQPPIEDFYRTRFREYPLGAMYLAAVLGGCGHECAILDARLCRRPKKVPIPSELSHLAAYYTEENDLFLHYQHFGMTYEDIAKKVAEARPDAVVINSMFTAYESSVFEIARHIKLAMPNVKIVVGGHHATADPKPHVECPYIDRVVLGEGEQVIGDAISSRAQDKIFNSKPSVVERIDDIPFPARHLVDPKNYLYNKRPYTMLATSRGCPHACEFCSVHRMSGHRHRARGIDAVVDEMDECAARFGIRAFDLQDDNLLFDPARIKTLLEKIISRFDSIGLEMMASNGLNVAHIDEELIALMKRSGFRKLDLAIVSSDIDHREKVKRPETMEQYEKILALAAKLELPVTTYMIIGMPTESLSSMRATFEYLKAKPTLISPSVFYNVPGMPIFEAMRKHEHIDSNIARRGTAFNCSGNDFSRDDILRLFNDIRGHNLHTRPFK